MRKFDKGKGSGQNLCGNRGKVGTYSTELNNTYSSACLYASNEDMGGALVRIRRKVGKATPVLLDK